MGAAGAMTVGFRGTPGNSHFQGITHARDEEVLPTAVTSATNCFHHPGNNSKNLLKMKWIYEKGTTE